MNTTPSKDENQEMLKWLNRSREQLKEYAHQYIAYNSNGIIAHGSDLHQPSLCRLG
ncbi:DUF5678 domain-containing protein [Scytonema hofmannii]|nr:DUF5678 domain-containing protein [Scytonema hofmannii]